MRVAPSQASEPPQAAAVWVQAGIAAQRRGDTEEAARCYRHAIASDAAHAEAHHLLGLLLCIRGQGQHGVRELNTALKLAPENDLYRRNFANYLLKVGRITDAARQAEKAAALNPDDTANWSILAQCAAQAGDSRAAFQAAQRALRLKPDNAEAMNACGLALMHAGDFAAAEDAYHCSLGANPNSETVLTNLANCLQVQRKFEESLIFYKRALALAPKHPPALFGQSSAYLSLGRYREGWQAYEWRQKLLQAQRHIAASSVPVWQGEPGCGQRLLIRHEQGLGDMIQFVRLAVLLEHQNFRTVYSVPKALKRLFAVYSTPLTLITAEDDTTEVDLQVPLLSLPDRLQATHPKYGAKPPYFMPKKTDIEHWRQRLAALAAERGYKGGPFVGLNWAGRPRPINYLHRHLELDELAPVLTAPTVNAVPVFSLQKEPGARSLKSHPLRHRLINLQAEISDMYDTAAIMMALDVMISCDSAPLHLAGALNRPAIGLLPYSTDWRWQAGGSLSPYYPSLRLLRQRDPGNWHYPLQELLNILNLLQKNHKRLS